MCRGTAGDQGAACITVTSPLHQVITERLLELGDRVPPILVLPVYSLLPSELQAKIFDKAEGGARKVT